MVNQGHKFQKGHLVLHDVSAAGRKGARNSPWRHGNIGTLGSLQTQQQIRRNAKEKKK
jgi:hypothetical protein